MILKKTELILYEALRRIAASVMNQDLYLTRISDYEETDYLKELCKLGDL